jgi:hypothetical protein
LIAVVLFKIGLTMQHIINPVYYQDFILSGKPEFTLKSLVTGNEEIFVVRKSKYDRLYYVNNRLRKLIGRLMPVPETSENVWSFVPLSKANTITKFQEKQIEIFEFFWSRLLARMAEPEKFKVQVINHTGRCGHCHRPLTHPESIPIGIGPDCFKKLGLTHKTLINHG